MILLLTLTLASTAVPSLALIRYPNASWEDSAGSMAHSFNVFLAASRHRVRRVVLASSNHVMGGYKDLPGSEGDVTPGSPPRCGARLCPNQGPPRLGQNAWRRAG